MSALAGQLVGGPAQRRGRRPQRNASDAFFVISLGPLMMTAARGMTTAAQGAAPLQDAGRPHRGRLRSRVLASLVRRVDNSSGTQDGRAAQAHPLSNEWRGQHSHAPRLIHSLVRFWSSLARGWAAHCQPVRISSWCAPADTVAARLGQGLLAVQPPAPPVKQ